MHKCQRMVSKGDAGSMNRNVCECHRLGHFLISVGYELGYSGKQMYEFLQGSFYFQPNLRLPFPVFVKWVQLEISKGNYEFARECLVKQYIQKSNLLLSEATNEKQEPKGSTGAERSGETVA